MIRFGYSGDTQINGTDYWFLQSSSFCTRIQFSSYSYTRENQDSAYIREDTALGKVFARVYKMGGAYTGDTSEIVLYDYNLGPGDTFTMHSDDKIYSHIVTHLDTVAINGLPHKRWYLSDMPNNPDFCLPYTVIEGVGSFDDPLYPHRPVKPVYSTNWGLLCFDDKNRGSFPAQPSWYSDCSLDIRETPKAQPGLTVFPNPAASTFYIKLNKQNRDPRPGKLTIYNSLGQQMVELLVVSVRFPVKISAEGWDSGIYLIVLQDHNGFRQQAKVQIP